MVHTMGAYGVSLTREVDHGIAKVLLRRSGKCTMVREGGQEPFSDADHPANDMLFEHCCSCSVYPNTAHSRNCQPARVRGSAQ